MKETVLNLIESLDFNKEFIKESTSDYVSYASFFQGSFQLKEILEKKNGMFVAIMDNSMLLAQLYFAVLFMNRTIIVIDPQKSDSEKIQILEELEQICLLTDKETPELSTYSPFLLEKVDSDTNTQENCKKKVLSALDACDFEEEYLRTFTSGTSGTAKGVRNSLNNLFSASLALGSKVKLEEKQSMGHCMPMTYMGGILNTLFMPFLFGLKIVILPRFDVKSALSFWKTIEAHQVDALWLSPFMLDMILQLDRGSVGTNYCKEKKPLFLIGFSNLTPNLREKWEKKYNSPLLLSYGLSETLFVSTEIPNITEKNTVGVLLDGVEWKSTAEEFMVKVPWMFLGYSNRESEEYFQGDYYKTGDIVEIKDGFVRITGRTKDIIIRGGMNLSPITLEQALYQHPALRECAVVGTTDMSVEEKVICAYVLEDEVDTKTIEKELKSILMEQLGKIYQIDYFLKLEEIPKNLNGKTDKDVIRNIVATLNNRG